MTAKRLEIRHYGQFLATRHRGRQIYADAEEMLAGAPDSAATLILDFADVKAVTVAFADELVANLVANRGPRLVLAGLDPFVAEIIELALSRRKDLP